MLSDCSNFVAGETHVNKRPMSQTQFFIDHIRVLISTGQPTDALRQLSFFLQKSPLFNEALLQSARYQDIRQQIRLGLVDGKQASLTQQQILGGVLELLSDIEAGQHSPEIREEMANAALLLEEADEYRQIKQKIHLNQGAGTAEVLRSKSADDLDEKELVRLFEKERVVRAFDEEGISMDGLTARQRLAHLALAENGHLFKGTFLCLGKRNQIPAVCPTATESKFIHFKGVDRVNILALETLSGNILHQFERMMMLLRTHIPLGRDRAKSEDIYEIPVLAMREFVANAFVHRDYGDVVKSYIQVELFDDRLEIKSPGHLPKEINVDNITGTFLTNPTIAALFYLYKHIERAGTGINIAQQALLEHGLDKAVIENLDYPKMVRVTIRRKASSDQEVLKSVLNAMYIKLEDSERALLSDLAEFPNEPIPAAQLAESLEKVENLTKKGLLNHSEVDSTYSIHPLIRAFFRQKAGYEIMRNQQ